MASLTGSGYRVWGTDRAVYGPVELPDLVSWIKDERVTADTWIFSEQANGWSRASEVPELQMFYQKPVAATGPGPKAAANVSSETAVMVCRPGSLRRVRIFAEFSDEQLIRFMQFMEVLRVRQWTVIVKQGDHGDAMYMVLEGELRVRLMIAGKETLLVTLPPGEFFGEISLFDHGPRSADVVANQDSMLLKVSVSAFERLIKEAPELAAPFLFAMGKTLTGRIRADNKRYRDSINFARAAGQ